MRTGLFLAGLWLLLATTACSEHESAQHAAERAPGEPQHVWKDQVRALDKAKRLEDDMNEAFERRAGQIEEQAR